MLPKLFPQSPVGRVLNEWIVDIGAAVFVAGSLMVMFLGA